MPIKLPFLPSLETHPKRTFLFLSTLLVTALYWGALSSPFVYDDLDGVVNNPNLAEWGAFAQRFLYHPVNLTTSLLRHEASTYRPLFWLSLFIDRGLWGLNALGFHTTNVALHLLNGNLVFTLLRRLKLPSVYAAATGLLWLTLPANTEVVTWVSGRAYALCTAFVLLTLLFALTQRRSNRMAWGVLSFIAACCAVLSHELGIVALPLLLLLCRGEKSNMRSRLITFFPVCLAILTVEAVRLQVGVRSFAGFPTARWAMLAFAQFLNITLLPFNLSVERSTSISEATTIYWPLVRIGCFLVAAGYAIWRRVELPFLLTGLTWFIVCTAPFFLLINYQGVAERFVYLSGIGLAIAVVALSPPGSLPVFRKPVLTALGLWCVWNLYRTSVRVGDWSDPVRLYQASLQATPLSPSLHYNLAFSYRERGDLPEAAREYKRTLDIAPYFPNAYASLGDVYLKQNLYAEAQAAYRNALAQAPNDTAVLLNSGAAYQGANDLGDAENTYKKVVQIDSSNSPAHVNLGVLYLRESRANDAMHQFAMAIDLKSQDITPYYDLGALFQQAGRPDLALVLYKKVLELKPDDADTLHNMQTIAGAKQ